MEVGSGGLFEVLCEGFKQPGVDLELLQSLCEVKDLVYVPDLSHSV